MNNKTKIMSTCLILILIGLIASLTHANQERLDRCGSPYFLVKGDGVEKLPLKSTSADVQITGVIANIKVTQVYVNEGKSPIEAIYVFPGSTRAAVYSMNMTIGERTINAKIEEREKARKDYETAKQNGQSASLLEQQRPNVFQMNVANIMPGDRIVVNLNYVEDLVPEEGIYSFVYPTVVGPRYSEGSDLTASTENWIANPYLKEGENPTYAFDIDVALNAGMPIKQITCTSHNTDVKFKGPKGAEIHLKPTDVNRGNKDFIVEYKLADNKIESGLLLYEGKEENFFMAMIQPPKRLPVNQIPGREYIFVVDVSGSMNGFPLDVSKELLRNLISELKPTDVFNVVLFAAGSRLMASQSLPATQANINQAMNVINRERGGGGTQLLQAMQRVMNLPLPDQDFSRSIVVVTDGYIGVEKQTFDVIRNGLGNSNVFAFGIGTGVNRHLIEGMSRVGMGESFVVTKKEEATKMASRFRKYISAPLLTNVKVEFEGMQVSDVQPQYIPDVLAERPIIITGKYTGSANGKVHLKGVNGGGPYMASIDASTSSSSDNKALRYLWARKRIELLDDYSIVDHSSEIKKEVTHIGLKYNLLTAYTSFIAVDNKARNVGGQQTTVKQPLPLPEGVSNLAVSGNKPIRGYGSSGVLRKQSAYVGKVGNSNLAPSFDSTPADNKVKEVNTNSQIKEEADELRLDVDNESTDPKATFTLVEIMPQFVGGELKMQQWIKKNLRYPQAAKKAGIKATVVITFIVDEQGNITDVKIARSATTEFDKEALRLVNAMPKWRPGMQRGGAVKVKMTLPIRFEL